MSTIGVDNARPSAGGTSYSLTDGVAKAWVNFNGTGTIATRDSYNLTGLTDNAAGDYSVSYTNNFSGNGYSYGGMSSSSAFAGAYPLSATSLSELTDPSSSSTRINSGITGSTVYAGDEKDSTFIGCLFIGDLA